jgi:hypothetical protein
MIVFAVLVTVIAVIWSIVILFANHAATTSKRESEFGWEWHAAAWTVVALFWLASYVG